MIRRAQIRRDDPALDPIDVDADMAAALDQDLPRIAAAVVAGCATALDPTTRSRMARAAGIQITPTMRDSTIARAYLAHAQKGQ